MTNAELLRHHIAVCDSLGMDTWTTHVDLARSLLRDLEQRDKLLEAATSVLQELIEREADGSVGRGMIPLSEPIKELKAAIAACEGE